MIPSDKQLSHRHAIVTMRSNPVPNAHCPRLYSPLLELPARQTTDVFG